jgi:hypothetical protein
MHYIYVSTKTGKVECDACYLPDLATETPRNVFLNAVLYGGEFMNDCIVVPRGSPLATLDVYRSERAMDTLTADATYVASLQVIEAT